MENIDNTNNMEMEGLHFNDETFNEDAGIEFEVEEFPNIIKVVGVGGGGSNAVDYMYQQGIKGVDFVVCNTDIQALKKSPVPYKLKLGNRRLGAGSRPEVGRQSAIDSLDEIKKALEGETEMLFITAGMGGGTGTGAAPVIAEVAKEMGILTVGIVTLPFEWEGSKRVRLAQAGIEELRKHVDTIIVISNSKLRELYGDLSLREAFSKADDILKTAAKGIAELITVPGYVNVDFEDVKTVMTENESGKAIMSSATAEGDDRAIDAVEEALNSPLLDDNDITGASDILLHIITGEKELTMDEIEEITNYIQNKVSPGNNDANIIWGNGIDPSLGDALSVTIIATGFDKKKKKSSGNENEKKIIYKITDETEDAKNVESNAKPVEIVEKEENDEPRLINKDEKREEEVEMTLDTENKPEIENGVEKSGSENKETGKIVHDLFSQEPDLAEDNGDAKSEKKEEEIHVKEKPVNSEEKSSESEPEKTDGNEVFYVKKTGEKSKHAEERRNKLIGLSENISFTEMENTPAYKRKNLDLDNSAPSQADETKRYSLGLDSNNNIVINKGNPYLNKDVD